MRSRWCCPFCKFEVVFPSTLDAIKAAHTFVESHVRYHRDELIAEITDALEKEAQSD